MTDALLLTLQFIAGAAFGVCAFFLFARIRTPRVKVNVRCILTVDEMKRLAYHHASEQLGEVDPTHLEQFGWVLARRMMALSYPSDVWIDGRKIDLTPGGADIAEEYDR